MNRAGANALIAAFFLIGSPALADDEAESPAAPGWETIEEPAPEAAPKISWSETGPGPLYGYQPLPESPLEATALRLELADNSGAINHLARGLEKYRIPRTLRSAARLLLGSLYLRANQPDLASKEFTRVRLANGVHTEEASYLEALADYERGRYSVAARECQKVIERWPNTARKTDCLLIAGQALAKLGRVTATNEILTPILEKGTGSDDIDTALLAVAEAKATANPERATQIYRHLACNYRFPTTAQQARAKLLEIHPTLPEQTVSERMACALSARDALLRREAWATYQDLINADPVDPKVPGWSTKHNYRFEYKTRQFGRLATRYIKQYEATPSGKLAWSIHRAFVRAGNWAEASRWGEIGLTKHKSYYRWRRGHEAVAWAAMQNGDYRLATKLWEVVGRSSGRTGSLGRWYTAYSRFKSGELTAAREAFDALEARRFDAGRLRYYRWRVAKLQGDTGLAKSLERAILAEGEGHWWALMLRARQRAESPNAQATSQRDGKWPQRVLTQRTAPMPIINLAPLLTLPGSDAPRTNSPAFARTTAQLQLTPEQIYPRGYTAGPHYAPNAARKTLEQLTQAHGEQWPELKAAYELARVGAYTRSGARLGAVRRELKERGRKEGTRASALRKANISTAKWTEVMLYTRAHHFVAKALQKASVGTVKTDEERHARQLSLPIAWPELIWPASEQTDLDPMLVLAVIRKESLYRADAVSSAGAVGLMQVMPTTGALVAARLNEPTFSPRRLSNPETSIRYGTAYLSWLSERFEGVLPLMIGAYNAGPYAVSSWLNGPKDQPIALDDWTEQIPYRETRRYVKAVLGAYGAYVEAYHPEQAVSIDLKAKGDNTSVVEF